MKSFDKADSFMGLLFFIGLGLGLLEITIFQSTFIKWQIPFSIWLITGIVATIFCPNSLKRNSKNHFGSLWKLYLIFSNCVAFGGITVFTFMLINFKSPDINFNYNKVQILKKATVGRKPNRNPVAKVYYKGLLKTIHFTNKEKSRLNEAKYLALKTKRGRFGFDVIVETKFIDK